MKVDGKGIQQNIKERIKRGFESKGATLALFYVGNDPIIEKYMQLKSEFGKDIGVRVETHRFDIESTQEELESALKDIIDSHPSGVVIQLPLPSHLDRERIFNFVPANLDPDMLSDDASRNFVSGESPIMPPVVGAIDEIFRAYDVDVSTKSVVVVGRGKLVGKPISLWLLKQGVSVRNLEKGDDLAPLLSADVVIAGAGSPHLIKPSMIKEGAILIDAGTSDTAGGIKGDVDPACEEKASLYSGVPGGVGPITVAKLFENLLLLRDLS